jgi:hypothetical protein
MRWEKLQEMFSLTTMLSLPTFQPHEAYQKPYPGYRSPQKTHWQLSQRPWMAVIINVAR